MSELRWNPFVEDWVIVEALRQNCPQMPTDFCPFCPGSGYVPPTFDVLAYDNDFPTLTLLPDEITQQSQPIFQNREAYGKCEVILYSPEHTAALSHLSDAHMKKLVELWCSRFEELKADFKIKYILIFENRSEIVGVTMPHPHGQIYAFPFVPKKISIEIQAASQYQRKNVSCLYCDFLNSERIAGERVLFENEAFTVILPYFCEYPYGVYVISNRHMHFIDELTRQEKELLGTTLRDVAGMYDALFGFPFPYMMTMHNAPVNVSDLIDGYHFHVEFYSPMHSVDNIRFNASSETGAWTYCNPTSPEEKAQELRDAYSRFKNKKEQGTI